MPGSEFRLLPLLPVEFNKYRTIMPWKLGAAMSSGWVPVAALNYYKTVKGTSFQETRYLVGKDPKNSVVVPVPISHQAPHQVPYVAPPTPELRGGSVGAELSYPQPEDDLDPPPPGHPKAEMSTAAPPALAEEELDDEVDQVAKDMDELLGGKSGDDGSEDDDE
jgi:hypothetical protein